MYMVLKYIGIRGRMSVIGNCPNICISKDSQKIFYGGIISVLFALLVATEINKTTTTNN